MHEFGKGTFAPSIGHFVMKLETYLRMAEIPYEVGIVSQIGLVEGGNFNMYIWASTNDFIVGICEQALQCILILQWFCE